ncbi:M24 family metallopeptidase [Halegenticoccus soli]|uniref:M24 family metallopeptidase n=1 Tax=Halegenticoccus soli TaxID=1985678 RepID=UPI000C6DB087|nr:M24 family metallopeptidase [Halegenticoccus soli]
MTPPTGDPSPPFTDSPESSTDSSPSSTDSPPSPPAGFDFLDRALAERGAAAFVHVGDRFDADLRYLCGVAGYDGEAAFVSTGDRAVLSVPSPASGRADPAFGGEVRAHDLDASAGERASRILSDLLDGTDGNTVLVPRHVPHDAAVYLRRTGHEVASTRAVARARAVKTGDELDRLRRAQRAATRAMARAEAILAESTPEGDALVWNDDPLSAERLRRRANETLAGRGASDAGNTAVEVGGGGGFPGEGRDAGEERSADAAELSPGETVTVRLAPRGPHGYHGFLRRTFVVEGDGGWERRAHVAAEAALNAGLAHAKPGESARTVREEVLAEVAAYGFDPDASVVGDAGHGVGLDRREAPRLTGESALEAGNVLAVTAGVDDPDEGRVLLSDLAAVTDEGCELLGEYPRSIVPRSR